MKIKDKIFTFIICFFILILYILTAKVSYEDKNAIKVYNVYLDGKRIGIITDENELYNLIDKKQETIKKKYHVDKVFPPTGLKVVENYTYNPKISDVSLIYDKIEKLQDFAIMGYEIKVSEGKKHKEYNIYTLDKKIFDEAVHEFILAFIEEEGYNNYVKGIQKELDDIGHNYSNMDILENIVIQKKLISAKQNIYENSDVLAQDLLFGFDFKEKNYQVKEGDTIESISNSNSLNPQEFLIANPKYASKDSLLKIGDIVNITLINPILSFQYTVHEMKEVEYAFDKTTKRDNNKPANYSEITTPGVKGISLIKSYYNVVNGYPDAAATIEDETIIRQKVDQVTTKGRKVAAWGWESYDDSLKDWKWPTQDHYAITSEFAFRWGKHHDGIDISGTGWGSKIYAARSGVVVKVEGGCPNYGSHPNRCNGGWGNYILLQHDNMYTIYAHLIDNILVKQGQSVDSKQVIGYMGSSGDSTGYHLHFGIAKGHPFSGGHWINPRDMY